MSFAPAEEEKEENARSERLRKDYKGAFDEWALQVSRVREAAGGSDLDGSGLDGSALRDAEQRAAAAEAVYRDSRDRLTEDMGWTPPKVADPTIPG